MAGRENFAERVVRQLLEQLEQGTAPFQRPWEPASSELPFNPTTDKRYRGANALYLMGQGRADPRWLTYRQAQAIGAHVRKGEKGTAIQYWKFHEKRTALDAAGKPMRDAAGDVVNVEVQLARPQVFGAVVFNGEQVDGLPALVARAITWDPCERAEALLRASAARIDHSARDRAFYAPATDTIHLPDKGQFPSRTGYYAVALHELGHWTGHASRLNRDLVHPFGSEGYAREELRAEIASLMLGHELGVGHDPKAHASYVASWIAVLKRDPLELMRAATDAEKIGAYLLGLTQTRELEPQHQAAARHPHEYVFEHAGLRCAVVEERATSGKTWLVGYVDLPRSHPHHGHDFANGHSLEIAVPRGFTYSEGMPSGDWRVGFDTAERSDVSRDEFIAHVRGVAEQLAERSPAAGGECCAGAWS